MTDNSEKDYDFLFKILILGDSSVGKTLIIQKLKNSNFDGNTLATLGIDFQFHTITVSNKRIKSMSKKLFGKAVSYKKIPKGSYEDVTGFMGVYRNDADKVMLYVWDGETETDTETIKLSIKKSGKGYAAVKELYHGYWGWNDHKTANYRVTYKIEKNSASSYGYVITGMTIECIANINPREDD